jgi:uncharacterized protein
MTNDGFLSKDKVLPRVNNLLTRCAKDNKVKILSVVLFGSRAQGIKNSQSDYELLLLLDNSTLLEEYIKFSNIVRLELLKENLSNVKIAMFTPQTFQELLFHEETVGTYLYIICKNNVVIYDKHNTFVAIMSRVLNGSMKQEEKFLMQCIKFSQDLGSEKWGQKWEKALLNLKYGIKKKKGMF